MYARGPVYALSLLSFSVRKQCSNNPGAYIDRLTGDVLKIINPTERDMYQLVGNG